MLAPVPVAATECNQSGSTYRGYREMRGKLRGSCGKLTRLPGQRASRTDGANGGGMGRAGG